MNVVLLQDSSGNLYNSTLNEFKYAYTAVVNNLYHSIEMIGRNRSRKQEWLILFTQAYIEILKDMYRKTTSDDKGRLTASEISSIQSNLNYLLNTNLNIFE